MIPGVKVILKADADQYIEKYPQLIAGTEGKHIRDGRDGNSFIFFEGIGQVELMDQQLRWTEEQSTLDEDTFKLSQRDVKMRKTTAADKKEPITVKDLIELLEFFDPRAQILGCSDHESPCALNVPESCWLCQHDSDLKLDYDCVSQLGDEKVDSHGFVYREHKKRKNSYNSELPEKYYLTVILSSS